MPENERLSRRSSSASLDSLTGGERGVEETLKMPIEANHFVHTNNDTSKTQLETVNNRESLKTEPRLKFVNNNNNSVDEGLNPGNHFEDESNSIG